MKKKNFLLASILILAFMLTQSIIPAIAQEIPAASPAPAAPAEEQISLESCPEIMNGFIRTEEQDFMTFLDTHFKNELENSVLFQTALDRYRLARVHLNDKLSEFTTTTGQIPRIIAGRQTCEQLIRESLDRMQFVLKDHAIATAYGKQGLKITDKYKAINKKLRDLNFDMANLRAYFYSFNNALPSYTEKCGS